MDHSEAAQNQAVERYLLGEMTEPEAEAFEMHFFECPVCSEELKFGALLDENAKAVAAEVPAGNRGWVHGLKAWLRQPLFAGPAFAALALAVLAGYQAQELALLNRPQAAMQFTLKSVLGVPSNVIPANRRFIELDVDLQEISFQHYRCDVYDASGQLDFSVPTGPPSAGPTLSIVVTRGLAPGKYALKVLGIRDSQKDTEVAHYQFEAVKQ
jgi:hypothetical protein